MTPFVGQHIIVPLPFNAVCGTVVELDGTGGAILKDAHDIFGGLPRVCVDLADAQPFDGPPRMLGLNDIATLENTSV